MQRDCMLLGSLWTVANHWRIKWPILSLPTGRLKVRVALLLSTKAICCQPGVQMYTKQKGDRYQYSAHTQEMFLVYEGIAAASSTSGI